MAAAALERLDREINGEPAPPAGARSSCERSLRRGGRPLAGAGALGGGSLELRWRAGEAMVDRRPGRARAGARQPDRQRDRARRAGRSSSRRDVRGGSVRIAVADSGRALPAESRRGSPAELIARLAGRRRRGHGLRVVRRIAADARRALRPAPLRAAARAVLELPLAGRAATPTGRMSRRARAARPSSLLGARRRRWRGGDRRRLRRSVARGYGPLRPVVVLAPGLPAGQADRAAGGRLGAGRAAGAGALRARRALWPLRPRRSAWCRAAPLPPAPTCSPRSCARRGGAGAPAAARRRPPAGRDRGQRRRGAARARPAPAGSEGRRGRHHRTERAGPGRTYVAAAGCRCWRSARARRPGTGRHCSAATLGLTRRQALRLIAAESFARRLTLLPRRLRWRRGSGTSRSWPRAARAAGRAAPGRGGGRGRAGRRPRAARCASWSTRRRRCSARRTARRSRRGSCATPSASGRSRTCSPTPRSRR